MEHKNANFVVEGAVPLNELFGQTHVCCEF